MPFFTELEKETCALKCTNFSDLTRSEPLIKGKTDFFFFNEILIYNFKKLIKSYD